jgi:hypothetical protein
MMQRRRRAAQDCPAPAGEPGGRRPRARTMRVRISNTMVLMREKDSVQRFGWAYREGDYAELDSIS